MNNIYFGLYFFSVAIAAFSQILLKISANKVYKHKWQELINPIVISAYGIFTISMVLTTLALKEVPFKMGGMIESSSYLLIFIFSRCLLKEKLNKKRLWGNLLIMIGIIIFNL